MGESPDTGSPFHAGLDTRDILLAWRDFECGFFCGRAIVSKSAVSAVFDEGTAPDRGATQSCVDTFGDACVA